MLSPWIAGHATPGALLTVLLLALAIDAAAGDPRWLYRRLPHPVAALGALVARAERALNRAGDPPGRRALVGALLVAALVALAAAAGWALVRVLAFPFGWVVEALLASTLIAFRGLYDAVRAVAVALERSLAEGRRAVAGIVGRDPQSLDAAGVARAAAESAAENFADGLVAPVVWFVLLGLPGLCAYKAINTLDSMLGHRDARHRAFGRAAARLDDAANWLPARLAALVIAAAAAILPGARPAAALKAMRRDGPRHRSVNAGWPEAALAGALGLALAGPRRYGTETVDDPWMGDGRAEATAADLRRALDLYVVAGALVFALVAAGAAFL